MTGDTRCIVVFAYYVWIHVRNIIIAVRSYVQSIARPSARRWQKWRVVGLWSGLGLGLGLKTLGLVNVPALHATWLTMQNARGDWNTGDDVTFFIVQSNQATTTTAATVSWLSGRSLITSQHFTQRCKTQLLVFWYERKTATSWTNLPRPLVYVTHV